MERDRETAAGVRRTHLEQCLAHDRKVLTVILREPTVPLTTVYALAVAVGHWGRALLGETER